MVSPKSPNLPNLDSGSGAPGGQDLPEFLRRVSKSCQSVKVLTSTHFRPCRFAPPPTFLSLPSLFRPKKVQPWFRIYPTSPPRNFGSNSMGFHHSCQPCVCSRNFTVCRFLILTVPLCSVREFTAQVTQAKDSYPRCPVETYLLRVGGQKAGTRNYDKETSSLGPSEKVKYGRLVLCFPSYEVSTGESSPSLLYPELLAYAQGLGLFSSALPYMPDLMLP